MVEDAGAKTLPRRDMGEEAPQRSLLYRRLRAAEPRRGGIRQIAALDARDADQRVEVGGELRLQVLEAQGLLVEVDGEHRIVRRRGRRLAGRGEPPCDRAAGPRMLG